MQSLPLVASFAIGLVMAPATIRTLREQGLEQENYRGARLAFPAGIAIVAAAVVALVPLGLAQQLTDGDVWPGPIGAVAVYVVGVALLGVLDDLVGSAAAAPRGWRGHAAAVAGGRFSTGALKALGALGLALFVFSGTGLGTGEYLLAVALLVLTTNLFNLLDLRPGRSIKALVLLGAGLTIGALDVAPLWVLGLFVGPILAVLPHDLRERGMLGDTGSNVVGAVAGLWLVLTLDTTGQAIALALVALATVYGEFRSISALIERTPGLRQLDSLGRIPASP
ncbi:MAG: hypothetical protein WD844_14540 [Thermoleophilaceae bacterium]